MGYKNHIDMFADIKESYEKVARDINADLIIPSGEVFQKLIQSEIEKIHRDTFHANLGIGRYTLGLLWYAILSGNEVEKNSFNDFDEAISMNDIEIVKQSVSEVCNNYSA